MAKIIKIQNDTKKVIYLPDKRKIDKDAIIDLSEKEALKYMKMYPLLKKISESQVEEKTKDAAPKKAKSVKVEKKSAPSEKAAEQTDELSMSAPEEEIKEPETEENTLSEEETAA